jgi:hypothetical protein
MDVPDSWSRLSCVGRCEASSARLRNPVCVGKKEIAADTAELLQGKESQLVHSRGYREFDLGSERLIPTCHNDHDKRAVVPICANRVVACAEARRRTIDPVTCNERLSGPSEDYTIRVSKARSPPVRHSQLQGLHHERFHPDRPG